MRMRSRMMDTVTQESITPNLGRGRGRRIRVNPMINTMEAIGGMDLRMVTIEVTGMMRMGIGGSTKTMRTGMLRNSNQAMVRILRTLRTLLKRKLTLRDTTDKHRTQLRTTRNRQLPKARRYGTQPLQR